MTVFPVNPLSDFGVDLAELWALRCSGAQMAAMGITFDQLLAKSITPQIRSAFAMTLSDWADLHFAKRHSQSIQEDDCQRVFVLSKAELVRILRSFAPEFSAFQPPNAASTSVSCIRCRQSRGSDGAARTRCTAASGVVSRPTPSTNLTSYLASCVITLNKTSGRRYTLTAASLSPSH